MPPRSRTLAALTTVAVVAMLLPAGWLWGRIVARPLVELAAAMGNTGQVYAYGTVAYSGNADAFFFSAGAAKVTEVDF